MDALSSIFTWLSELEAGISAVVGITVLAGVVFAGLRSLVRRRGETAQRAAPTTPATEPAPAAEAHAADLNPLTVPGFEGRPAIAVLPFDNLSGDPEQEYFADGIAEDLITRLSAWRDFPVIARNSSFTYKGKPVDVKQVSRARSDLNVTHRALAATYAQLGRMEEARTALQEDLRLNPDETVSFTRQQLPYADPGFLEPYIDALRKAGMPE